MVASLILAGLVMSPATIDWDAPAGCPSAEEVRSSIEALAGDPELEPLHVTGRVVRTDDGKRWRLSLMIGPDSSRQIEADDCAALADAAVVMVGLSLNATIDDASQSTEPQLPPPPLEESERRPEDELDRTFDEVQPDEPPDSTSSAAPVRSAASPEPPTGPRWEPPRAVLGLMTGVHGVGLPEVAAQLGARLGVQWGPLRLAAVGSHWFRRSTPVVDDVEAAYTLSTGGVELCGVLPWGRNLASFEGLGCGALELGRLLGQGQGARSDQEQRHLWVAPGFGAGLSWTPRQSVALGLRADLFVPTRRHRFVVGDAAAGMIGPIDARGTLVIEVRLPNFSPAS